MDAPKKSLKILVVDDEALIAMGLVDMLEDLGHAAFSAGSAQEALTILREQPAIDLVITDQSMPQMSGTELAREVLALRPGLPVFLSTGYSDTGDPVAAALPRLNKPYSQSDLDALIAATFA